MQEPKHPAQAQDTVSNGEVKAKTEIQDSI